MKGPIGFTLLFLVAAVGTAGPVEEPRAEELLRRLEKLLTSTPKSAADRADKRAEIRQLLDEFKVIYGPDDRLEFREASDNARAVAGSTVALVPTAHLKRDAGSDTYELPGGQTGVERSWCADERFYDQPSPAFCSGFLVSPTKVATAGHCIRGGAGDSCAAVSFVFDFHWLGAGSEPHHRIPARNIHQCDKIVDGELDGNDRSDWRVVTLKTAIAGRVPLMVRSDDALVPVGTGLTVVGHPVGLPTKIAGNASVRDSSAASYLVANLDTYGGNSGSAVLSTQSIQEGRPVVEGILVRGEADFEYDMAHKCYRSKRCEDAGCRGEDVTRASEFAQAIK